MCGGSVFFLQCRSLCSTVFLLLFLLYTEDRSEQSRQKLRAFDNNYLHMYPSFVYFIIFSGEILVTLLIHDCIISAIPLSISRKANSSSISLLTPIGKEGCIS